MQKSNDSNAESARAEGVSAENESEIQAPRVRACVRVCEAASVKRAFLSFLDGRGFYGLGRMSVENST